MFGIFIHTLSDSAFKNSHGAYGALHFEREQCFGRTYGVCKMKSISSWGHEYAFFRIHLNGFISNKPLPRNATVATKKINENYFCLWEILITLTFAFSFFLFFFEFTDIFRDSGNRLIIPFTTSKTTKQISQKYFILFSCLFPLEWARAGWSWSIIFVFFFNF